ncbi:hypothetical protein KUL150_21170 [Alteromonas sp. KUL150]|uniref:hypothetical protein n=1 Tax=Alteromonas sp. KUL150 TaxID=2480805 RepID=UPI0012E463BB|nr:hypothetical protein [Alteromonas sp. KUL150]GFD86058.1 hypothetical protein KUL150_21170 [Alteromonas sp. KUL150]
MENNDSLYQKVFGTNSIAPENIVLSQDNIKAVYPELFIKNTSRSRRNRLKQPATSKIAYKNVATFDEELFVSSATMHSDAMYKYRYPSKLARLTRKIVHMWFKSVLYDNTAIEKDVKLLLSSSLFDANWYKAQYQLQGSTEFLVKHYLLEGYKSLKDPSEHFSTRFYLAEYSDVAASPINPLVHYLTNGVNEKRKIKAQSKK